MSSNTSKYACPKCGNPNIQTERRPDGFHHCTECWYSWKNGEEVKLTNGDRIRQMNTSGLIDVIVCPYPDKVCIHRIMNGYACRCCKRDWLNAPAESEVNNEQ